ncbi:MAG TPA: M4 family peptidase, partial [Bacteroidetes bacterium]|nr:M4 family peptidase [Bacteroidota bacterium]
MFKTFLFFATALTLVMGFTFLSTVIPAGNGATPSPASSVFYKKEGNPDWLGVKAGIRLTADEIVRRYRAELGLGLADQLELLRADKDDLGFVHYRYQQYYKGVKVEGSQLLIHEKGGQVQTLNGKLVRGLRGEPAPVVSKQQVIATALQRVAAHRYMWEDPAAEALLREIKNDPTATYYPVPQLVWVDPAFGQNPENFRLAYSLTIYAQKPQAKKWLFADARTGEVFHEIDELHTQSTNTPGMAETKYHGLRSIITDSLAADSFRLFETTRGRGIHIGNLQNTGDTTMAVDFYDDDNYWNNVNSNQDEVATDAFWAAEMTFDYYFEKHSHPGIDGDSMALRGFVHYGTDVTNAFWNGAYAVFGDGSPPATPLTSLDVVGHEFTHGITDYTADLIYQNESGALNESFSDIFGAAIEFFADPDNGDWEVGEDFLLQPFRNMADPNEFGDPDTYFGDNWVTSSSDNGGVHSNSGVQNYWFYLLTEGAVDTNDFDRPFEVIGLGLDTAAAIAFRNLKFYLTPSSRYADARFGSVQAAADLFGDCSFEMQQTISAWYAVGVGPKNPTMDISLAGISGLEPFKCEVGNTEQVSIQLSFSDCDTSLPAGAKIPVYYQVNANPPVWDTVVLISPLAFGDTVYFTFGQPIAELAQPGIYTLTAGADLPGDNTPDNNLREMTLERIYNQNVDLAAVDMPMPLPGCFLDHVPLTVEIGFVGCDFIEGGQPLEVSYRLNDGPAVSEAIVIPHDLQRGDSFLHTFEQEVDLSEIKNHRIEVRATFAPDTLTANDTLPVRFVVNPVQMIENDYISFEAGMASTDSFYFHTGPEPRAFISTDAARDGLYGFQVTGGDVVTAFFNNEVVLPEVTTVWDLNPQFKSKVCFCTNLHGLADARFKFRMKLTYSPIYNNDLAISSNLTCA